ncbi:MULTISPECIES: helix-turn-helix domain-containing protein [Myroides]|uniref:Helix-turn-helix domain-containing protein n=1 Tax=Myroides albus TaxID=2562892 RepID=A0A6I3LHG5_9FLAO|nr:MULTISPECIES: AraC family transcriptional regulator [Myroides]MTG97277.1 helix-turn-helix domain-containing protein [Myroides albus]MVX34958.1 helix-turn-helix domain-containing protein [Myroides sp. LoEW2-1]UVD80636.1 AraC family transcriptional regulator [Myroides albus]
MSKDLETIKDYYKYTITGKNYGFDINNYQDGQSHFNINTRKHCHFSTPYNRRDFFKICLIIGQGKFKYGKHTLVIDKPTLFLPCPTIPYEWESCSENQEGYFCLFNKEFFHSDASLELFKKTSLFKEWSKPFIFLADAEVESLNNYFMQMYEMAQSSYPLKYEIIRNLVAIVLHKALQLKAEDIHIQEQSPADRLYRLFDNALDNQFPLDSPAYPLLLKTPKDFAQLLNVHVNHLNAIVKKNTGNTTTQVIKNRVFEEAKNLLKHTTWDIAEIGYTLGFDHPTHFNNFFKKYASITPLQFKNTL